MVSIVGVALALCEPEVDDEAPDVVAVPEDEALGPALLDEATGVVANWQYCWTCVATEDCRALPGHWSKHLRTRPDQSASLPETRKGAHSLQHGARLFAETAEISGHAALLQRRRARVAGVKHGLRSARSRRRRRRANHVLRGREGCHDGDDDGGCEVHVDGGVGVCERC